MKRCLPLLFLLLLMAAPTALAQETILIGENKLGEISATNPQPAYLFNAQTNQTVEIEILGVSAGLAPTITLLTPQGAVLQFIGNPTNASSVKGTVTFTQAGTYTIQVATSNGSQGQFVISVTDTAPQIPPTPLNLDETVTGEVASTQRIAYSFTSAPDAPLVLNFTRVEGPLGLKVELNRADSTPVALLSSELLGTSLTLPPGNNIAYLLIITNETPDSLPIGYTLNLTKAAPTDTTALPELPTTGACVLATQGQVINVRPGPGTNYNPPITTIPASGVYNVVGRNEDSSWWKINYGGGEGWVGGGVTRRGGNCSNVPVVSYPPPPQETPEATEQPTQEATEQPTQEATEAPTQEATPEATQEA
ncbi:MAG: SH3 domain-containing protein [Anaerolineae bacterium]|nr:SH3 domain-containing protein [Anaerolineae bacterium]